MIVVSMTSWRKRIDIVGKSIYHFLTKQTLKPDKFILTLSSDEFPNKEKDLPNDLNLIIDKFNINLNWIKKNIYGHKKYEPFKEHNKDAVILIDDDILYEPDYVEKLFFYSKKYPKCVICYYSIRMNYINGRKQYIEFTNEPSDQNILLSGLSCFPPNTFPLESFEFQDIRDEISRYCDDSWVNGWLIKKGIKIVSIYDYSKIQLKCFKNTQKDSIWAKQNSKTIKGVNKKYITFSKVLDFLKCENIVNKIWPGINIKRISKL